MQTVLRKRILISTLAIIICLAFIIVLFVLGYVSFNYVQTLPRLDIDDLKLDFTSFIYEGDMESQESKVIHKLHDEKNRVWVDYEGIPDNMKNAIVAIEDQRFWEHRGIDFRRTILATYNYFLKGQAHFGGSTITQQLVKNLTLNNDVTVKRKFQEMWQAFQLEKQIGKEKILELYLNTVFFGEGAYGVQAAANIYFQKDVTQLSLAESATIAGITQLPEKYNPFINIKENKNKQKIVLKKMLELKYIEQDEYKGALQDSLHFRKEAREEVISKYSYFVDQVLTNVLQDLQNKKGYSRALASKLLYSGGLKIYSTIDTNVQEALEKVYEDDDNFPDNNSQIKTNSAMVIIDPHSGEVKGLIGGRGKKTAMRTLNRATQALRQPGSAIKPISVYAPALDLGIVYSDTVFEDAPYTIENWSPNNWYNGYWGNSTVRKAVEQSMNIIAVKVLELVGIERSFNFLKNNLGLTTLVEKEIRNKNEYTDKLYSALALGGFTDGVTVLEMAAAYVPFANKGIYIRPYIYSKVIDHYGNVVLDNKESINTHMAMREQTAYTMTQMMVDVVNHGTAKGAKLSRNMPVAGKTGTTSEDKDRWFVGYTPYYVGAVWFGYDIPKPMENLLKGKPNPSVVIWKKAMEIIHRDLSYKNFEQSFRDKNAGERGILTFADGRIYEGEIKDEKANGHGVMTYPDGNRYYGDFVYDLRQGKGTLLYAGGNKYEGEFDNDKITGKGKLVWTNGDEYIGEWQDGRYNGEGTFNWVSGDSYSGRWLNDKFNGVGTFRWASGDRYEGEWFQGKFHGEGTFYWANGDVVSGKWENGEKVAGKSTNQLP